VVLGLGHIVIEASSSANNLEPLTHVSGVFRKFPGGFLEFGQKDLDSIAKASGLLHTK